MYKIVISSFKIGKTNGLKVKESNAYIRTNIYCNLSQPIVYDGKASTRK